MTIYWFAAIAFLLLLIFVIAFAWLISIALKQPKSKPHRAIQSDFERIQSGQFQGKELELLRLLYGDKQTAIRLIQHVRSRNPQKSFKWCVEKVITDLEYDRRS